MAIDDNTSYELTGAQVKDLVSKIKAKADSNSLATVATTGDYTDLTNKPTIPAAQVNSDWDAASGVSQILNKPSLATVATSGSYNDLTNQPTIPTVNDATLTIQQNGTTVGTFTANQSTNTTINLTGGGSTYTAGNGIDITNDVISADTNVLATTKLAKDLVGGVGRIEETIYMVELTYEETVEVATQIGGESYPAVVSTLMVYGFRYANSGTWLNKDELGAALEGECPLVFKPTANSLHFNSSYQSDVQVIAYSAGYDEDLDEYFPTIKVMYHHGDTSNLGKFEIEEIEIKAPTSNEVWYVADKTTVDTITTPYCIIRPSSAAFIQQLADEYNEAHADPEDPSSYISPTDVQDLVPFMFISQSGTVLRTAREIGQALRNTRVVVFNSDQDGMGTSGMPILGDHNGSNTNATFSLYFPGLGEFRNFNVRTGQSSEGQYAQYMPYIVADDGYNIQYSWAYTDDIESSSALSSSPDSKYAIAKDANGNLYMAADTSSASDWKQINNDVPSVTYYLQSDTTAGMSGITTYIYTDSNRTTPADPATLVDNFNAGKIILLEYEQTGAAEPFGITFQVNSASADGDPTVECQYKLLISEINNSNVNYNVVVTQFSTTVTAGTTFTGIWNIVRNVRPTVNNGTLTIQQNGTTVGTFTANQSSNATANISVPTQFSDLSGSVTSSQIDWSTVNSYNYSSSEQVIGTWIDGRNVYRKVFTGTTKNAATENITNTITNFGNVLKVYGFIEASGTGSQPIQRVVPDNIGTYGIGIGDIDQTRILFQHPSSAYQGQPYALVLEYIKTS